MTSSSLSPSSAPLALFGGTFDPPHLGHVRIARDAAAALKLPEVRLIPSKSPVHRSGPLASAAHRVAMLQLALQNVPGLAADDCELRRESASYTFTTLSEFRVRHPTRPLVWFIGVDAFMSIDSWHRADELFDVSHFVVLNRPGFPTAKLFTSPGAALWQTRLARDASALSESASGAVLLHTVAPQSISSTEIRALFANGADDRALSALLAPAVLAYIRQHGLYGSLPRE